MEMFPSGNVGYTTSMCFRAYIVLNAVTLRILMNATLCYTSSNFLISYYTPKKQKTSAQLFYKIAKVPLAARTLHLAFSVSEDTRS